MSSEPELVAWPRKKLSEVTTVIAGTSPKSDTFSEDLQAGTPFLQGNAEFGERFPSPRKSTTNPIRIAPAGSVLISVRAPVGALNFAPGPVCIGRGLAALVPGDDLDLDYLFFALRAQRRVFDQIATGTIFPGITTAGLKSFELPVPPLDEQRRVAGVLAAIETKIGHSSALAAQLDEALRLLYRHLMSDASWPLTTLGEQATVVMGQSPPGSSYGDESPDSLPLVQGMGVFGIRFPRMTTWTSAPTKRALPGDVLVTVRAPVGEVNICREELCAGRGVAAIRSSFPVYTEQMVRALRSAWAAQESGTIFPAVNKKQIESMLVPAPSDEAVAAFEAAGRPIYDLLEQIDVESERLRKIRDELLPRLITGRTRVAENYSPSASLQVQAAT